MKFSALPKTWLLDIDGTILKHNGYKNGGDIILDGAKEFFRNISPRDKIILLTSREKKYKKELENFLQDNEIRYDEIIYDLPYGERICINDKKPSGLNTAYAINKDRDASLDVKYEIDEKL